MGGRLRASALGPFRDEEVRLNPPGSTWPNFTGTPQLVGVSPVGKVSVNVDPTLGAPALQNAKDLLADADRIVALNNAIFGITGQPTQVIVFALNGPTDGSGGADHWGCTFAVGSGIEVDAAFGNSPLCSALFEAELSECCMGGNLCGVHTGEALSRWCAFQTGPSLLPAFATGPTWMSSGMPNWVDSVDPSDQHGQSVGCGVVFLSWLQSLGHPLNKIAPAMVSLGQTGTLAQLYAALTSDAASNAWTKFQAAVKALSGGVKSDDPFNALGRSPGPPPKAPPPKAPPPKAPPPKAPPPKAPPPKAPPPKAPPPKAPPPKAPPPKAPPPKAPPPKAPPPKAPPPPSPGPPGGTGGTGMTQFAAWAPPPPGYPPLYPPAGLLPPAPATLPGPPGAGAPDLQQLLTSGLAAASRSKSLGMVAISGLVIMGIIGITALSDGQDGSK